MKTEQLEGRRPWGAFLVRFGIAFAVWVLMMRMPLPRDLPTPLTLGISGLGLVALFAVLWFAGMAVQRIIWPHKSTNSVLRGLGGAVILLLLIRLTESGVLALLRLGR